MSGPIDLNRRFHLHRDQDQDEIDDLELLRDAYRGLEWQTLLEMKRVVMLAEPGAGKTTELELQSAKLRDEGKFAFHTTVRAIADNHLGRVLPPQDATRLTEWRESDQPGWFFFDAIDEAKSGEVPLERALIRIAHEIGGHEHRAHIVLCGRYADWEATSDLALVDQHLPAAPSVSDIELPDPNEQIVLIMRGRDFQEAGPVERPLVVVMAPLDRDRIRAYARECGVEDVDSFCKELDATGYWEVARRPVDLNWLIDACKEEKQFGSLTRMLEDSIRIRLKELQPRKARKDLLEPGAMETALNRIGAALVLQQVRDIRIPDSAHGRRLQSEALDLTDLFPDWSSGDLARLIDRAVFEPAAPGLARLCNDNEGDVRSFLAARWLNTLLANNCPMSEVLHLIFGEQYGKRVIRSAMRQVAAWMAASWPEIARECAEREPALLLEAGDPAALPLPVREAVLNAYCDNLAAGERFRIPSRRYFQRFASPDLALHVRELWHKYKDIQDCRIALLITIQWGRISACADIARSASFGAYSDKYTPVFSGRALMAVCDDAVRREYAKFIVEHRTQLDLDTVWEAVDELFPKSVSVAELLAIIRDAEPLRDIGDAGFHRLGPRLVERLSSADDVQALLNTIFERLECAIFPSDYNERSSDKPYLTTLEAGGRRLLTLSNRHSVPPLAVDAAIRLGNRWEEDKLRPTRQQRDDLISMLRASPETRRATLWRSVERLEAHRDSDEPISTIWRVETSGIGLDLNSEDVAWLIDDAESRQRVSERQVAATAVLGLWRPGEQGSEWLDALESACPDLDEVREQIDRYRNPGPSTEELVRQQKNRERKAQRDAKREAADQSWRDFADRLRADPLQLREIAPPTEEGVDGRLYHLWRLVDRARKSRSQYSISDLNAIIPILGQDVVRELNDALVRYWRQWNPELICDRPDNQRGKSRSLDVIGLVGVSLEAAADPNWAIRLNVDDAKKAAVYATLELNGFPPWLGQLIEAHRDPIVDVLMREAMDNCDDPNGTGHRFLQKLAYAESQVAAAVADPLFEVLKRKDDLSPEQLNYLLQTVAAAGTFQAAMPALLLERARSATDPRIRCLYLSTLIEIDPVNGVTALKSLDSDAEENRLLVQNVIANAFERQTGRGPPLAQRIPIDALRDLLEITFFAIRPAEDQPRPSGEAYSPTARHDAEAARDVLVNELAGRPGADAHSALLTLSQLSSPADFRQYLIKRANERAAEDAQFEPWSSEAVARFEKVRTKAPSTHQELCRLVVSRLEGIQHDLDNLTDSPATVLRSLADEDAVQGWVEDRLQLLADGLYTLSREPQKKAKKKPDLQVHGTSVVATVPVEIKLGNQELSLAQLEAALVNQLIGRYLRHSSCRHGVLLLVRQRKRARGWRKRDGSVLDFEGAVDHLRAIASQISAAGSGHPQAYIATLDTAE